MPEDESESGTSGLAADTSDESVSEEEFEEYVRRENAREGRRLPRSAAAQRETEPVTLSFAEYWSRNPHLELLEAQRKYRERFKEWQKADLGWLGRENERWRERCRRTLNNDGQFERVAAAIGKVEAQWRKKGVDPVESLRRVYGAWVALRVTVESASIQPSRELLGWNRDYQGAVTRAGEAIAELRAALARHPWIKGLERSPAIEDLVRAWQRLATAFPRAKRGRPRATWRDWLIVSLHPEDSSAYAINRVLREAGLLEKTKEKIPRK